MAVRVTFGAVRDEGYDPDWEYYITLAPEFSGKGFVERVVVSLDCRPASGGFPMEIYEGSERELCVGSFPHLGRVREAFQEGTPIYDWVVRECEDWEEYWQGDRYRYSRGPRGDEAVVQGLADDLRWGDVREWHDEIGTLVAIEVEENPKYDSEEALIRDRDAWAGFIEYWEEAYAEDDVLLYGDGNVCFQDLYSDVCDPVLVGLQDVMGKR